MVAAILSLNGVKNNPKIVTKITAVRPKGEGGLAQGPLNTPLSMTRDLRRFVDMLDVPERLQQLHQSHGVGVVTLINMNVEITTNDDWTAVDRQTLKCC